MPKEQLIYEHTQPGHLTMGVAGFAMVAVALGLVLDDGLRPYGLALIVLLGVVAALFSTLTVSVTDRELSFRFGPGFWRRSFPLRDIERIRVVQNSVLYGWGIRYTPHGWLYNVSGLQAVEVAIRRGRTLRIGTDEPERLQRAVEQALRSA